MNILKMVVVLLLAVSQTWHAMGQANVNEQSVKQTLYVSPEDPKADDSGPGISSALPLKSLQKAIDKSAGVNTKIVVLPGDCRELVTIPPGNSLLVIEAREKGKSAISGSDLFADWKDAGGVYEHEWPKAFGPMAENHFNVNWTPLERRRELAFVNGQPYRQVLSQNELVEKSFCISEADKKVYIKPPSAFDMKKATVEISVRGADPYGQGRNGAILHFNEHTNAVLRGLVVRHSMCGIKQSAVAGKGANILFEDCSFNWNNGIGLDMVLKNSTFRHCVANNNGERGLGLVLSERVLLEDCECSYNNWRYGEKINGHDSAGFKAFWECSNISFLRFKAICNNASGIWFDWNNGPVTIKSSLLESNRVAGLNYEANPHGLVLTNCVLRYNDHGLMFYGSSNVTIEACAIYGNGKKPDQWGYAGGQITLVTDDRVVHKGDWSQKYLHEGYKMQDGDWRCTLGSYTIRNCIIESTDPAQSMIHGGTERTDITAKASIQWCKAVRSDFNTYYHPKTTKGFFSNVLKNNWEDDIAQLTLEQWREQSNQDLNSQWKPSDLKSIKDPTAR
ncbi:MAG TPA: right-handed parallel beta-helix repeat-containing protein [Desulfuromonadaceae bacterium]